MIKLLKVNILMLAFLSASCFSKNNAGNKQGVLNKKECVITTESFHAIKEIITNDSAYKDFVIDSTSAPLCVTNDKMIVYFIKVNVMDSGLIARIGYISLCLNKLTRQHSKSTKFFYDEMIELSADSISNERIRLLTGSHFTLSDYDGDGNLELIVKQRVHNGTFYHAVLDHFYGVDSGNLNLNYKFSVESIGYLPAPVSYVKRIIQKREVKVYLTEDRYAQGKLIGKYLVSTDLDSEGNEKADSLVAYDDEYKEVLFTSSPIGVILPPNRYPR